MNGKLVYFFTRLCSKFVSGWGSVSDSVEEFKIHQQGDTICKARFHGWSLLSLENTVACLTGCQESVEQERTGLHVLRIFVIIITRTAFRFKALLRAISEILSTK